MKARRLAAWAAFTALLACSDPSGPDPLVVDRIELSAPSTRVEVGAAVPVTLTARNAAGQVVEVREVAWSSSDTAVATVTAVGLVSARAVGAAVIRAAAAGRTGELQLTVVAVPVASVTVVPDTATLEVGGRRTLAAVARGADGRELAGRAVRWSSADTLVAAVLPDGTVEGRAPGTAVVTAQVDSARGSARVTVVPTRVASVTVSPDTATLLEGSTRKLTAVARSASGAELTGRTVRWSSGDTVVAVVGADGTVEARAAGTTTIIAQVDSVRGTAAVTVRRAPVATLAVVPDTVRLTVGSTRQLVAVARSAEGKVLTGRGVRWSSGNERVATVGPEGVVAGAGAGTATVAAEVEGVRATATIIVTSIALPALGLEEIPVSFIPVHLASAPGDPRMYVAGLRGTVHVVQGGQVLAEPFLDLTDRVSQEDMLGLYSIVLHPRFAENGYVYVDYTDRSGVQRIERYTASADRTRADRASAKTILSIPHPAGSLHYGGGMLFAPDGTLLIATGDAGPGNNQQVNSQDMSLLLGKMLRIDVDRGDPYTVPADNPFVGRPGVRPEIWASGLRNPWRMALDRPTGLLYVADVGELDWEEIDVVPVTAAGLNYGWGRMEGSHCFPPGSSCSSAGLVLPVLEYTHPKSPAAASSTHPTGCSITGGVVYRGSAIPGLRGHYFYGDLCESWVRSFRLVAGQVTEEHDWKLPLDGFLFSFGEDGQGELYAMTYHRKLYRIVAR